MVICPIILTLCCVLVLILQLQFTFFLFSKVQKFIELALQFCSMNLLCVYTKYSFQCKVYYVNLLKNCVVRTNCIYWSMSFFLSMLRLLNLGVILYTGNKTQTYNFVVNIKSFYLEIHSAGTHVHASFTVCVCVFLPSCIIQCSSGSHSVLSPYLHISNIWIDRKLYFLCPSNTNSS